ncbi:MAG: radical SAM protein [Candidatus Desulfofervidaceae bacterium]|nr:radical SAM protein [Candidatus Desulfofervidaceae bacterium]
MISKTSLSEWSCLKRWNPFNSYKLLAHVLRWKEIKKGNAIPPPVLVTIDPINACNLQCIWCNANYILRKNKEKISKEVLSQIADFLGKWQDKEGWRVEAVCIAGGGEPLLHPDFSLLVERLLANNIAVGVVTNGTCIDKHIEALAECTWVGVSIDAGSPETFNKLKNRNGHIDWFSKVLDNIQHLVDYAYKHRTKLAFDSPGYGVSYKYLLHPENVHEVYQAARIAKEVGCKNFHLRPVGAPWDKLNTNFVTFTSEMIKEYQNQIEKARQLENKDFGVYGVTHKFGPNFTRQHNFKKCYAIFMTGVFMPPTDGKEGFTLNLCCDRRGDGALELIKDNDDPWEIAKLWGGPKHWEIFERIKVDDCPRCTYAPHNEIYENVIMKDSMTYKFI